MLWLAVAATVASGAAQAYGQTKAGADKAEALFLDGLARQYKGTLDNELANQEAGMVKKQAIDTANIIRRKFEQVRGQLIAAQGGSGVVIGEGSAQVAADEANKLAVADMMAVIGSGINRAEALKTQGRFAEQAGEAAFHAGVAAATSLARATTIEANSTLLSTAAKAYIMGASGGGGGNLKVGGGK